MTTKLKAPNMLLVRLTDTMDESVRSRAKKEGKTLSDYIRNIHQEHCMRVNQNSIIIECPHCKMLNMRKQIKCDHCCKEY